MPADAALQIGLYDKFLSEAYPEWSDAQRYEYLHVKTKKQDYLRKYPS